MAKFLYKIRKFLRVHRFWNPRFDRFQNSNQYGPWEILHSFEGFEAALVAYRSRKNSDDDHAIFYRGKRVERCHCGRPRLFSCNYCILKAELKPKQAVFAFEEI